MTDRLRPIFERCQLRYPTVDLAFQDFAAHIDRILAPEESRRAGAGEQLLQKLHHEDLFLALACSQGNRIAWEYFIDDYLPRIRQYAGQACRHAAEGQDLAQEMAAGLLEDRGRLAGYNGHGSLAGWLRVSVSHAAIDRFRRNRRQVSLDEAEEEGRAIRASSGPAGRSESVERLDARWAPVLLSVLAEQIKDLTARDRLLLSLYYLRDVPLKLIGRHFGVHEATASRWLDRVRRGLRKGVEREMKRRHGLRPVELEYVLEWVAETGEGGLCEVLSECKDP
jgi:RNA polymerase sigma-70 factor